MSAASGRVLSSGCTGDCWPHAPLDEVCDWCARIGEGRSLPLCGDSTCESYGCTQEAIDAWHQRNEDAARDLVRSARGLPPVTGPARTPSSRDRSEASS